MIHLLVLIVVLTLAALVFELHESRKERKSLALLIKSETVHEFVRAETQLEAPRLPLAEPEEDVDITDPNIDPQKALNVLRREQTPE